MFVEAFKVFIGSLLTTRVVLSDLTIHHCAFSDFELANRPNAVEWIHELTEDECSNGLPSGTCVAAFERTRPICDARYAVMPGDTRSVGPPSAGVTVTGPAVYINMGSQCSDFDASVNNVLYKVDWLCDSNFEYDSDVSWRTLCQSTIGNPTPIDTNDDNTVYTFETSFVDGNCDYGLPLDDINNGTDYGKCIQFIHDQLIPGSDFGSITYNPGDSQFPGYQTHWQNTRTLGMMRTQIAYICDAQGLENFVSSDDSGDSDPLYDKEWRTFNCRVPNGNDVTVLSDYNDGNDLDASLEYVWYQFTDDDCVDSNGDFDGPPSMSKSNVDCIVSIRSQRACGKIASDTVDTREALNRGEYDSDIGVNGPGILFTRPKNENCENEETIIEVDYLCAE